MSEPLLLYAESEDHYQQQAKAFRVARGKAVTALWAAVAVFLVALAVFIADVWAYANPLTNEPFMVFPAMVEPVQNMHLRRFMFLTWRTAFSATTAAMILLCLLQRGTWLDAVLSWQGWVPAARLTYSAYLLQFFPASFSSLNVCHSVFTSLSSLPFPAAFMLSFFTYFLIITAMTFLFAFIMYMVAEKPIMDLRSA